MTRLLAALTVLALGTATANAGDAEEVQKQIDILKDPDKSQQSKMRAIQELGLFKSKAEPALPHLKEYLFHKELGGLTIAIVGKIGQKGIPMLIEVLDQPQTGKGKETRNELSKRMEHKQEAMKALKLMGGDASRAVKSLIALSQTPTPDEESEALWSGTKYHALDTLGAVANDDEAKVVATHLGTFLNTQNKQFRGAAEGLKNMGPKAKAAVPAVITALEAYRKNGTKLGSELLVSHCTTILTNVGPDAADALPVLRELLKDSQYANGAERAIEAIKAKK